MSADRVFSVFSSFSQRDSNTLANSDIKKTVNFEFQGEKSISASSIEEMPHSMIMNSKKMGQGNYVRGFNSPG